ncbi:hypothetical protein DBV15_00080 [Temnothorax longispinosus]|uniref:Uncharacterized protein n=1 Tax=Temnothorax longispinosus TaxID=300112 RepID=A0A4S2KDX2_9HYME|nr:hypothetical protein DBV15_00080 [Temnothorax longispinosus]
MDDADDDVDPNHDIQAFDYKSAECWPSRGRPLEGPSNETYSRCFGLEKGVSERWCHLRGGRGASSKGGLVSREPPEARHRAECATPGVCAVSRPQRDRARGLKVDRWADEEGREVKEKRARLAGPCSECVHTIGERKDSARGDERTSGCRPLPRSAKRIAWEEQENIIATATATAAATATATAVDEGHAVTEDRSPSLLAAVTMASSLPCKQCSSEEYDLFPRLVMLPKTLSRVFEEAFSEATRGERMMLSLLDRRVYCCV